MAGPAARRPRNGRGAAGEDDALQIETGDGCAGRGGGDQLAVDVLLADAARDEPAVLRAVVDNGDALGLQGVGFADAPARAGGLLALLGDAQVGGDFHVAARRHPVRPVGERRWGVVVRRVHAVHYQCITPRAAGQRVSRHQREAVVGGCTTCDTRPLRRCACPSYHGLGCWAPRPRGLPTAPGVQHPGMSHNVSRTRKGQYANRSRTALTGVE